MPLVLITGASHGIGRAVAAAFAEEEGARLALVSRNESLLEERRRICRERGADAEFFLCDVTDEGEVGGMATAVLGRWGVPDVVVSNARSFEPGSMRTMNVEAVRAQLEYNVTRAYLVSHAVLNEMMVRRSGHLIYLCAVASIHAHPRGAV